MTLVLVKSVKSSFPNGAASAWKGLELFLWSSLAIPWMIRFPIFWDVPTGSVSCPPLYKEAGRIWCQISFNLVTIPPLWHHCSSPWKHSRVTETGLWHHNLRQEERERRGEERIETAMAGMWDFSVWILEWRVTLVCWINLLWDKEYVLLQSMASGLCVLAQY